MPEDVAICWQMENIIQNSTNVGKEVKDLKSFSEAENN